jgi:branched-chain amino acid aminotransferase
VKVSIDGRSVDTATAAIGVLDHGFLYGDGVFEGLRVRQGHLFRLDDHLRRLAMGAAALGLNLPGGLERVRDTLLRTCREHGAQEAYVRFIVTRGEGPLGVDPSECGPPRTVCIVGDIALHSHDKQERGIDMITSSWRRPPADVLDPRIKSLNYLNSVLAKREARLRGADEALLLNVRGLVAEAAVANVFVVRRGVLLTPPVTDGALEGVTRQSVIELARERGVETQEVSLGRADLLAADEVFLTGSGAGILPVATLDGSQIGTGGRALTRALRDAYLASAVRWGTRLLRDGAEETPATR